MASIASGRDGLVGRDGDAAVVVAEITSTGRRAITLRAEVTRPDAIRAMFATAVAKFGKIDIVVANAGVELVDTAFVDCSEVQFEEVSDS